LLVGARRAVHTQAASSTTAIQFEGPQKLDATATFGFAYPANVANVQ
jgi:hypothetical protein